MVWPREEGLQQVSENPQGELSRLAQRSSSRAGTIEMALKGCGRDGDRCGFLVTEALGRVRTFAYTRGSMKTSPENTGAGQEDHREETVNHSGRRSLDTPHPLQQARDSCAP